VTKEENVNLHTEAVIIFFRRWYCWF